MSQIGEYNLNFTRNIPSIKDLTYTLINDGLVNYDLLYSGLYDSSVHDFISNKLTLGIIGD